MRVSGWVSDSGSRGIDALSFEGKQQNSTIIAMASPQPITTNRMISTNDDTVDLLADAPATALPSLVADAEIVLVTVVDGEVVIVDDVAVTFCGLAV